MNPPRFRLYARFAEAPSSQCSSDGWIGSMRSSLEKPSSRSLRRTRYRPVAKWSKPLYGEWTGGSTAAAVGRNSTVLFSSQGRIFIGFVLLTRRNDLRSLRFDKIFGWQSFSNCRHFSNLLCHTLCGSTPPTQSLFPSREVHAGYTAEPARVIPLESRRNIGGGGGSRNIQRYWKRGTYWFFETLKTLKATKLPLTGTYLERGIFIPRRLLRNVRCRALVQNRRICRVRCSLMKVETKLSAWPAADH